MDGQVSRLLAESATLQRLSYDLLKDSKKKSEAFARLSEQSKRLCEMMESARHRRFLAAVDAQGALDGVPPAADSPAAEEQPA